MNYRSKKHESRHDAVNAIHYFIDDIEANGLSVNDRVTSITPLGNYYGIRSRDKYLNKAHERRLVEWVADQSEPNQNFDKIISLCRQLSVVDVALIVNKTYECDGLSPNTSNFRNVIYAIRQYYPQYMNNIDFSDYFSEYMNNFGAAVNYFGADYWHVVSDNYGYILINSIINAGLLVEYVNYINGAGVGDSNINILANYLSKGVGETVKVITVGAFIEYYHLPDDYALGVIL